MASLSTSKEGLRRVDVRVGGKRRPIRLGRLEKRQAEIVRNYCSKLETAISTGEPIDAGTADWLGRISDELRDKLAAVGLVKPRGAAILKTFLDGILDSRKDIKPNTRRNYNTTRAHLLSYLGEQADLRSITAGKAAEWRQSLINSGFSQATVSREAKRARQFFRHAIKLELISANPFDDLPTPAQVNTSREFYVTPKMTQAVLDECPDNQWKLIVSLSRYAGLRCPSEHARLKWQDIDWQKNRMTIHSPKTEHHDGGDCRVIPIFPEVRPFLEEAWDAAEEGETYVIRGDRDASKNWRTQLRRFIKRAGLTPWPRLFQNMRASCETDLTSKFPLHVVCKWIGNSEQIAAKHYLQVNDSHYEQAIQETGAASQQAERDAERDRSAGSGIESHAEKEGVREDRRNPINCNGLRILANPCAKEKLSAHAELVPPRP